MSGIELRASGSAKKMMLEMFGSLEEVVCVVEHDFELEREPLLRREKFRGVFGNDLGLSNHMVDLVMALEGRKMRRQSGRCPLQRRAVRGR